MANQMSLSKRQVEALHSLVSSDPRLESIDGLVEQIGQEEAFRIFELKKRLADSVASMDD